MITNFKMATPYYLVFMFVWFVGADAVCEDLNTAACSLFLASKPDLCQDQTLSANCKRFCGLCPLECYSCTGTVIDPDDCNTTSTCAMGEPGVLEEYLLGNSEKQQFLIAKRRKNVCMRKTHSNPDGSMEYILSCAAKTTCEGLGFGFHGFVGKRDISFHCCDVDGCNYPDEFTTTVTMPTTTTTTLPTTTLKPLNNCARDIVFMLDGSTTIGSINHNYMKQFVHNIVSNLAIGAMDSQVAMIEYSDIARVEWYLTDHMTTNDLQVAISNIPYVRGNTSTHAAFYLARNSVLTTRHGDRPNAKDVVVLLTDGGTTIPDLAISQAQELNKAGVDIVTVAVGAGVNQQEMSQYALNGHTFTASSFSALPRLAGSVVAALCK